MKQYLSFFRIRFLAGLQYRAAAWAGIATQFAWGGMLILMYRAFYENGANSFPMTFQELSSYIWMQQALLAMFMLWFYDNDIFDSITSGGISYELCRPCDLYNMWFVKNMAIRLSKVVLRCLPILLVAALLPAPFGMRLPPGADRVLHADLHLRVLHPVPHGHTDPGRIHHGVFDRLPDPYSVLPRMAAERHVRIALRVHAEHTVFDLHRALIHSRGRKKHPHPADLAGGAASSGTVNDETGAEKSCRTGRLSDETVF